MNIVFVTLGCLGLAGGISVLLLYAVPSSGTFWDRLGAWEIVFLAVCWLILLAVIIVNLTAYACVRPLVFDRKRSRMWFRGKTDPVIGDYARLKDVEALQVRRRARHVSSEKMPCYELNVLMKRPAGGCVTVTEHYSRARTVAEAGALAEFLGVTLMDRTEDPCEARRPWEKG